MTPDATAQPRRSHARANRARILAVARRELSANPEATIEEIARAAGVVRRTLYAHFPGRTALLEAIADEGAEALRGALAAAAVPADSPEQALARHTMELWRVGDRYRTLLTLGRQCFGDAWFADLTDPARRDAVAIVRRGQADGVFHGHLPAEVLASALGALMLSLLESVNAGLWEDSGPGAATAILIGAGVPPERAAGVAAGLAR
ncbi:TetR/AcrR family transcriptional regulator [Nonomuraea angiospora]|uniref:TetR/AcrR family transcriptional regulator n=1 Tax=Nonomuraea angiospora TaxID=46172 RepID=UPI0029B50BB1|nr:helix-turn-helix domain-containing protein [Nonomuraea angiospora]MDX3107694.1 helix-turn-helix domain containing protein [Nonomuraea angiospora]